MSNNDLIKDFVNYLKRKGKSKSTITAYETDLKQLASYNTNKDLKAFSESDIRSALTFLQQNYTLSTKSVSRKLNSIRTFFRFLLDKKLVSISPAVKINHPKFRPKKQRILTKMEYLALKEMSRTNQRLFTMIDVLLQTGIRISELADLKANDLEMAGKKKFLMVNTSDHKRLVPINDSLSNTLKDYIKSNKPTKANAPLFMTKTGKKIEIRNIRSSIDRVIAKAKIKNACVNDLRNTFIVHQLTIGMSLSKLGEIVGHKNVTTTSRYLELLTKKYKPNGKDVVVEL